MKFFQGNCFLRGKPQLKWIKGSEDICQDKMLLETCPLLVFHGGLLDSQSPDSVSSGQWRRKGSQVFFFLPPICRLLDCLSQEIYPYLGVRTAQLWSCHISRLVPPLCPMGTSSVIAGKLRSSRCKFSSGNIHRRYLVYSIPRNPFHLSRCILT